MKKALKRIEPKGIWYFVEGEKIAGVPPGLWGDVGGLWGNVTGLRGDVTGLWGDVDECEITDAERAKGVYVSTLIGVAA